MSDEVIDNTSSPDRTVTVLEISPFESDHATLQRIFSHSKWKLYISRTCSEAMALLKKKLIPVVLCECELPDGSWKDIVERTARAANPPAVIVSSRLADEHLWSEVLDCGGYNVLAKPFRESEVFRDVSLAWLAWKSRAGRLPQTHARPKAMGGAA